MIGGSAIEIRSLLLEEQARLEKIIVQTRKELENAPEGVLRIGKSQGCIQYYHCKSDSPRNGTYISKKNTDLPKQLAQKQYDEKILRYSEKTHNHITKLLRDFDDDKIEKIYYSENVEKQKLIVPVEETYEQKLKKWVSTPYTGKGFSEDGPVIITNSGIRVRSKSEKIMADYFDSIGLVYKYERPLKLKSYGTIYPDFTFLSKKTGKEIYWEHEGMMDNPDYAKSAVQKIELYEKNGIFPGEDLILTFETSVTVINSDLVKELVKRYLI